MDDILIARLQFALSLGFHIVFAMIGVAMPLLMVLAEAAWLRTGDARWKELAKKWGKGTAVLFAVGAVSGTVLSFELGLLFPKFMEKAGPVIGMPFSLEGFAFFTEAIFLGIYLYGWDKVPKAAHLASGVVVAASGAASAAFVTLVNAWMNTPHGVTPDGAGGLRIDDGFAAMWSPAAAHEILHMLVASYMSTALAVAAVHAFLLLRLGRGVATGAGNIAAPAVAAPGSPTASSASFTSFHGKALFLALLLAVPMTLVQPLVGHFAAQRVAELQPAKLAAMEGHFRTGTHAPLAIGGWPDYETRELRGALEIPGGLSFLAFNRFDAPVKGLEEFPRADWPHPIVHVAFQIMVACGSAAALAALGACAFAWRARRAGRSVYGHRVYPRWFLWVIVLCGPLGFIATEAGWIVTEVGRQPWVVYGLIRTKESVTTMPGLHVPFMAFGAVYLVLGIAVALLLKAYFAQSIAPEAPDGGDEGARHV